MEERDKRFYFIMGFWFALVTIGILTFIFGYDIVKV
jgi:hypothetical protein